MSRAQHELAREYSWPKLVHHVQAAGLEGVERALVLADHAALSADLPKAPPPSLGHPRPNDLGWILGQFALLGRTDVVRPRLDAGTEVEARGWSNLTPLDQAAMHGRNDTVRLLIERGADSVAPTHRRRSYRRALGQPVTQARALGFAERLAAVCAGVLGDVVRSAIPHGSLALGDYLPGRSDIDVLVIVDRPLARAQMEALTRALARSSAWPVGKSERSYARASQRFAVGDRELTSAGGLVAWRMRGAAAAATTSMRTP